MARSTRRWSQHLVFARALIERGRARDALRLLGRLTPTAEHAGRMGRALAGLVFQALAFQAEGETDQALGPLGRALALAEPEGYVRLFIDQGRPMAELLNLAAGQGMRHSYVTALLATFKELKIENEALKIVVPQVSQFSILNSQLLVEPLTQREIEVLRLSATGMPSREIAGRLCITTGTLKTHTKSIYGKLGVHNRVQAIERARELKLL
jgi:LuxR family transcriptional regulator, maltose regulon positive regulatory protein